LGESREQRNNSGKKKTGERGGNKHEKTVELWLKKDGKTTDMNGGGGGISVLEKRAARFNHNRGKACPIGPLGGREKGEGKSVENVKNRGSRKLSNRGERMDFYGKY